MPSEYWHANCLASLSFPHRAEIDMRHEMGIETLAFGRDYPYNESTGPIPGSGSATYFVGCPRTNSG
jgi:hypothetical protein